MADSGIEALAGSASSAQTRLKPQLQPTIVAQKPGFSR